MFFILGSDSVLKFYDKKLFPTSQRQSLIYSLEFKYCGTIIILTKSSFLEKDFNFDFYEKKKSLASISNEGVIFEKKNVSYFSTKSTLDI